jgi:hypothetical protein
MHQSCTSNAVFSVEKPSGELITGLAAITFEQTGFTVFETGGV